MSKWFSILTFIMILTMVVIFPVVIYLGSSGNLPHWNIALFLIFMLFTYWLIKADEEYEEYSLTDR